MEEKLYNKNFYDSTKSEVEDSVEPVLTVLKNHYRGNICSAVDLGCGIGAWLNGIKNIFDKNAKVRGYDGDYVDREVLMISEKEFVPWDLQTKITDDEQYDIAISLEVAEHIPVLAIDIFLDNLTKFSDLILFSAAVPNQGGTGHINEQPLSYWIKKFDERNYEFYDIIRPYAWNNEKVSFWYKQNIAVYIRRDSPKRLLIDNKKERIIDIIHPKLLEIKEKTREMINDEILWNCYKRIGLIRDLFDALPDKGIAIRMGGFHTKKLLSLIGEHNKKKIEVIIDCNIQCRCSDEGYPIMGFDEAIKQNNINVIVLSSFENLNILQDEKRWYPSRIEVIDLYQYLEKYGCSCKYEFYKGFS